MNTNGDLAAKFIGDGSAEFPGEAFDSEPSTGVYRDVFDPNPGYVISTHGNKRLKVSDTKIEAYVPYEIDEIKVDSLEVGPSPDDTTYDLKLGQRTGFIVDPYGPLPEDYTASLNFNDFSVLEHVGGGGATSQIRLQNLEGGAVLVNASTTSIQGTNSVSLGAPNGLIHLDGTHVIIDGGNVELGSFVDNLDGPDTDITCKSLTTSTTGTLTTGTGGYLFNGGTNASITGSGDISTADIKIAIGGTTYMNFLPGFIGITRPIAAGTNSITCGPISSSGTISNGTNSLTCGSIISSGTFSNGTNSMTCGSLSSGPITSNGTLSCGTNSMTCGSLSSTLLSSSLQPGITMVANGTQSSASGAVAQINIWNNSSPQFARGTMTYTNNNITAPRTGLYGYAYLLNFGTDASAANRSIWLGVNALTTRFGYVTQNSVAGQTNFSLSTSGQLLLTAGDTVQAACSWAGPGGPETFGTLTSTQPGFISLWFIH